MAFELVLEGQESFQEMVIVAPGEEAMKAKARRETHLVMFRGVLMVRVSGGLGPWLVQWRQGWKGRLRPQPAKSARLRSLCFILEAMGSHTKF